MHVLQKYMSLRETTSSYDRILTIISHDEEGISVGGDALSMFIENKQDHNPTKSHFHHHRSGGDNESLSEVLRS